MKRCYAKQVALARDEAANDSRPEKPSSENDTHFAAIVSQFALALRLSETRPRNTAPPITTVGHHFGECAHFSGPSPRMLITAPLFRSKSTLLWFPTAILGHQALGTPRPRGLVVFGRSLKRDASERRGLIGQEAGQDYPVTAASNTLSACDDGVVVLLPAAQVSFKGDPYELAAGPHACFLEELLESRFHRTLRDIETRPDFLIAEPLEHALQYLILPFREGLS